MSAGAGTPTLLFGAFDRHNLGDLLTCTAWHAAAMVAELFGARIHYCARQGEVARIRRLFPQGYIAAQFSADFGDDETLATIAAQLDSISVSTGLGVALFRAGTAPWHDELACFERVAARMRSPAVTICLSLNLWDICALIASSRAYCGSSLHGRIVAMAFTLPRINLRHPSQAPASGKQAAFAATWETATLPTTVALPEIGQGIHDALEPDPDVLRHTASELARQYRAGFDAICADRP